MILTLAREMIQGKYLCKYAGSWQLGEILPQQLPKKWSIYMLAVKWYI